MIFTMVGKRKMILGIQLYSIRDVLAQDWEKGLEELAQMGYKSVETAGFSYSDVEGVGAKLKSLGLEVPSVHSQLPLGDKSSKVIDEACQVGASCVISGRGPDDFKTADGIKRVAEMFNEARENASRAGLSVGYHNHEWEYLDIEGTPAYRVLAENLHPDVKMEIDTYWVAVGGKKPAEVIEELGDRVAYVHFKDGPGERGPANVAVGQGFMDFDTIFEKLENPLAGYVEFDTCDTDIMEASEKSLRFLEGKVK